MITLIIPGQLLHMFIPGTGYIMNTYCQEAFLLGEQDDWPEADY